MEEVQQSKLSKNIKIVVGIGMAIMLALGLILIAQGFIDAKDYQKAVVDAVQATTGKNVTVKGKVSVALLPTPMLYIPGLELRDGEGEHAGPALSTDAIRIKVSALSLFEDHPRLSAITIDSPVLELVRGADGKIRMDWLNAGFIKKLMENNNPENPLSLELVGGKILYRDTASDKEWAIEPVNFYAVSTNHLVVSGSVDVYGHSLQFGLNTEPGAVSAPTPFAMDISEQDGSSVKLKGTMDFSQDLPQITGELEAHIADALSWTVQKMEEQQNLFKEVTNSFKEQKKPVVLPLDVSGDWSQQGLTVNLSKLKMQGLGSGGAGSLKVTWDGWTPSFASEMLFSTFDFDPWKKLVGTAMGLEHEADDVFYHSMHDQGNPLPKESRVSLQLTAQEFLFGTQSWKNAAISGDVSDGAVTVNQFNIDLPGDAKLALFGIISQSPTGDMRFEGSMETEGKSLREALTVFDSSASGLPETGFGLFKVRSNIFVSASQLRLSEADVKLSDLHLNGGLAAYFDEKPRVEADMKLRNINFDYFRDAARENQKNSTEQNFFLKFNKSLNFGWLKKLNTVIDFHVGIEDFTFLERAGRTASFRLYAQQNEIGIHDLSFVYPFDTITGLATLNVAGEKPSIALTLSANEINTDYFSLHNDDSGVGIAPVSLVKHAEEKSAGNPLPEQPEEGIMPPKLATGIEDVLPASAKSKADLGQTRWSEKLIDMSWMSGYSASLSFAVNKLINGNTVLENVKLQTVLSNDLLVFKAFTFTYWGGQCSVLGSVYGGKVPGISINTSVNNARLHDMLKELVGRENISGNVSVSASLNTSGINALSWISQSNSKISLAARGVRVDGVNVQGVIDAVAVSRTASDVFNSVNFALPKGASTFSVDGTMNVKNGVIKTPGVTLKSELTTANLSGEVRLVPWNMELSTNFQFPTLSTETVPTLTVQLAGPMDSPQIRTDTASLEAFVAKRIISK